MADMRQKFSKSNFSSLLYKRNKDIIKKKIQEGNKVMLFLYSSVTVQEDWYVKETCPPSYCRIYYVHSGHVIYRDEHTEKELRVGHLYIFPSAKPYEMTQDADNPLKCLFLHVDISPLLLSEIIELEVKEKSFLYFLLETMAAWEKNHPFSQTAEPVMEELSQALVSYLIQKNFLQSVPDKIAGTISYIEEHVRERIRVEDLSTLCGYHTQYYIRIFREYMGITPHQYLINYRMKLGLQEMRTGKSVAETADNVGYPEVRNFIRAFKKYYGFSPAQVKQFMKLEP